jgi:hypothetical protein
LSRLRGRFGHGESGCGSTCGGCNEGPSLFERLRGRFHRNSGCDCGTGCGTGCGTTSGCCGATGAGPAYHGNGVVPQQPAEPLKMPKEGEAPKKLPDGKDAKDGKEARAPSVPKDLDLTPLEKAPDGENRRPF